MAQKDNKQTEIEFFFEYEPSYRVVPVNGAWGGLTPRGELKLDFFVESIQTPERIKNRMQDDGRLGDEISRTPERRIVRRLQVGILVGIEEAESIAKFIIGRVEELRKEKGDVKPSYSTG